LVRKDQETALLDVQLAITHEEMIELSAQLKQWDNKLNEVETLLKQEIKSFHHSIDEQRTKMEALARAQTIQPSYNTTSSLSSNTGLTINNQSHTPPSRLEKQTQPPRNETKLPRGRYNRKGHIIVPLPPPSPTQNKTFLSPTLNAQNEEQLSPKHTSPVVQWLRQQRAQNQGKPKPSSDSAERKIIQVVLKVMLSPHLLYGVTMKRPPHLKWNSVICND
jgi:hypothetical protein